MNAIVRFDATHGFKPSQPQINPLSIGIGDIIRWIDARKPLPAGRWNEIGQAEYARAFTAARTAGSDVIVDLYDAFRQSVADQTTEKGFADQVIPILKEKGWLAGDDGELASRVLLIYNANIRNAQAVSRWREIQAAKHVMPYLRYVGVKDSRERASHRLLNDITLPVDDPFWQRAYPPCGFRCRCNTIQYTRGQFARRNMALTDPDEAQDRLNEAIRIDPSFWARNAGVDGAAITADVVADANDRAVPGANPIEPTVEAARGRNAWASVIGNLAGRALSKLIDPNS